MTLNLWRFRNKLVWLEKKLIGGTIAYSSGIIINFITDIDSIPDFIRICFSFSKPAVFIMWLLIIATLFVALLSASIKYLYKNQNPSAEFNEIMTSHTDPLLNEVGKNELSWGFNKNIHRSKDPGGWLPDAFYISEYEDNVEYQFPIKNEELPEYSRENYYRFSQSEEMQNCIRKKNNKERFSVSFIEPNYNSKDRKVEIKIIRTDWVSLQFSWNYFRRLDSQNRLVSNKHIEEITKMMGKAFLDNSQES
ncbi:MAG: hypothetical protein IKS94_10285, partial [Prevotella sp.]|nr:hypothetical protein [Prevotella sp.]